MGMRQPARLSPRPAYGVPEGAVEQEHWRAPRGPALPLLMLVIALAAAAVWYVALPAFDKPAAKRTCEVVVLKSGSTACVREPTRGSRSVLHKSSVRAKR